MSQIDDQAAKEAAEHREAEKLLPCLRQFQQCTDFEHATNCPAHYRPAVAERLRQLHEAADHVADMLRESEAELENARERIAALEAERELHKQMILTQALEEEVTQLKYFRNVIEPLRERIAALEQDIKTWAAQKLTAEKQWRDLCEERERRIATLKAENERLREAIRIAWTALTQQEPPAVAGIRRISETLEAALAGRKR